MSQAIDVLIGLAFVFALVSLVCTGLQEMLSAALSLRGKTLWEGVQSMLQVNAAANLQAAARGQAPEGGTGTAVTPADAEASGANAAALRPGRPADAARPSPSPSPGAILEAAMRAHPLIASLIPDRFGPAGFVAWLRGARVPGPDVGAASPSYLRASTFATVLADKIGETWNGGSRRFDDFPLAVAAMPDCALKTILQGMVRDAQGDSARLRQAVESWFDETMVRVGGWYKRRIQTLLMLIGLAVAAALNVDAIHIATALAANPALAAKVADQAAAAAAEAASAAAAKAAAPNPATAAAPTDAAAQASAASAASAPASDAASGAAIAKPTPIGQAPQPTAAETLAAIGVAKAKAEAARKQLQDLNLPIGWTGGHPVESFGAFVLTLAGWLITAIAASFGAPFWFDLINKLVPLRSSGARPAAAPGAAPAADAAAVPPAVGQDAGAAAPAGAVPFRSALNDFEASGISSAEIVQLKRTLGVEGQSATTPTLDQTTRDLIRQRQQQMNWPPTGELSAAWLAQLRTGAG